MLRGLVDVGKSLSFLIDCLLSRSSCGGDGVFFDRQLGKARVKSTLAIEMVLDPAFCFLVRGLFVSCGGSLLLSRLAGLYLGNFQSSAALR